MKRLYYLMSIQVRARGIRKLLIISVLNGGTEGRLNPLVLTIQMARFASERRYNACYNFARKWGMPEICSELLCGYCMVNFEIFVGVHCNLEVLYRSVGRGVGTYVY